MLWLALLPVVGVLMKHHAEYKFICTLLQAMLRGDSVGQVPAGLDWEVLLAVLDRHGLAPVFWQQLEPVRDELPIEVATALEDSYLRTLYRQTIYSQEAERLAKHFDKAGVGVILLKGVRWAEEIYPQPGLRTFADVDILIKVEQREAAQKLIAELGYQPETTPTGAAYEKWHFHSHHYLPQPGVPLELHWGLGNPCRVTPDMSAVWQRARRVRYGKQEVLALSPMDDVLHLAMHIGSHGLMSNLIWFLDFALLLQKYRSVLDETQLWRVAGESGCKRALSYCMSMAGKLCGLDFPSKEGGWRERFLSDHIWRKGLIFTDSRFRLIYKYGLIDRASLAVAFTGSRLKMRLATL